VSGRRPGTGAGDQPRRRPARQARLRWSWQARDRYPWLTRLAAAGVGVATLMAMFGLPPIDLHGPLHWLGVMDPLCGGTRAARYTARGDWATAWRYNPLGIAVVVGSALLIVRAVVGILLTRWLTVAVVWTPARRRAVIAIGILLLSWLAVRQQLRVDLLVAAT